MSVSLAPVTWQAYAVATAASPASAGVERDAEGFGGLVPSGASVRTDATAIAILGLEHSRDGAVAHALVLTDAPGLLDWDVETALSVSDDLGNAYAPSVIATTQGLGQLSTTISLAPSIATNARRLTFEVARLARISPARGAEPVISRALSGGPWHVDVDLVPERTVADVPPRPERRQRFTEPTSVPSRSLAAFEALVPVGQARHVDGWAIALIGAERYSDRWLLTVVALAPAGGGAPASIGGARITAWDDRDTRYRATPIHSATGPGWSQALIELVPPLAADVASLAIQVEDVPCGDGPAITVPLLFGVRVAQ